MDQEPESATPSSITLPAAPPFPELEWDDFRWVGVLTLPQWAGFQSRGGYYGGKDSDEPSDGRVWLQVYPPEDDVPDPPTSAQAKALELLVAQETTVHKAIVSALMDEYHAFREDQRDWMDSEEFVEVYPFVSGPEDFRDWIGLSSVYLLPVEKDGVAYSGYEFGCDWDTEHGCGVLMLGTEVIKVGMAVMAFCTGTAEAHLEGRSLDFQEELP